MPLTLKSSGGGSVTLDTPSTASTYTLTVPAITGTAVVTGSSATISQAMLATGVAGTGPTFLVNADGTQSISNNTFTKLNLTNEVFDTANAFSSSAFTPLVAGYYVFSFSVNFSSSTNQMFAELRKNGGRIALGSIVPGTAIESVSSGSAILYMNGSTDYIELYGYQNSGGSATSRSNTYLAGSLVRAA